MKGNFKYITYGSNLSGDEIERIISFLMKNSLSATETSVNSTPIMIWGKHGIGKTELVMDIAKKEGYKFRYIAPAQFEEMGDLIGMPQVFTTETGEKVTRFAPPQWVPVEAGPGIFLIDDVNRADDRILRGIMQLLQNYELVSWKMPAKWQIILTGNPDGGDYSVTPLDDAFLTRVLHLTMKFDVKSWVNWARSNEIDERGISFVFLNPELVHGKRTTPRSLVQFFHEIKKIKNLNKEIELVKTLADGFLDDETSLSFIAFVKNELGNIILPKEILNASDFKNISKKIDSNNTKNIVRSDIFAMICDNFTDYLLQDDKLSLNETQKNNIENFLLLNSIPNDLRFAMIKKLSTGGNKELKGLVSKPEISRLVLSSM